VLGFAYTGTHRISQFSVTVVYGYATSSMQDWGHFLGRNHVLAESVAACVILNVAIYKTLGVLRFKTVFHPIAVGKKVLVFTIFKCLGAL